MRGARAVEPFGRSVGPGGKGRAVPEGSGKRKGGTLVLKRKVLGPVGRDKAHRRLRAY
ncbi:hypothetical protein SCWH03_54710 [Streptomyces pacificus]|uniref:Uncharacterized protein n=1 Tax=Streptomyces pacificus TaxID=2705029 RepID=A0A6A0B290_9ACTN|nr:hypothetical protein SCWH03_54710 [Streptomyces pacificus]